MNLSNEQLSASISHFIKRFHVLIFTTTAVIGTVVAIWSLTGVISTSSNPSEQTPAPTGFDTNTISRLERLIGPGANDSQLEIPEGRVNPLAK